MTTQIVLAVAVMLAAGCGRNPYESADVQKRSDALYHLFTPPSYDGANPRLSALVGKSKTEVFRMLGPPTKQTNYVHKAVQWTEATWDVKVCPTGVTPAEKEAWNKGWRYTPGLWFRNGLVVPFMQKFKEVDGWPNPSA